MSKNILIVSQVIPQWYVDLITEALPEDVQIDIITGSEVQGNIIASPKHNPKNFSSRIVCWFKHFVFMKKWIKQNKEKHYDLIFAVSNPPINSYIGLKLKKVFKAPFIYMNWDIYPQIIDLSIKNPIVHFVCMLWNRWNSKNYFKIDKMLTIGEVVSNSINSNMSKKIDIEVIPIAVDTKRLKPIKKAENDFCVQNDLNDKFVVLYSGKMGYGHNIELILSAAEKLKEYKDIQFVFIGEGQKYELVKNAVENKKAENIKLFEFQPEEIFPFSMACGDVGIVAEEEKMAHLFMPSKTYSMLACGMSVIGICSEGDDLYNLLNKSNFGYAVINSDKDKLCDYILNLYNNAQELSNFKSLARKCAEEVYDIAVIKKQYSNLFDKYL